MSSDFLVDSTANSRRQFVVQVKSSESLNHAKITEKLEIERRYWLSKQIPWFLVTEQEIDPVIKQNISWMYPTKSEGLIDVDLIKQLPILKNAFHKSRNSKMIDICKQMDTYSGQAKLATAFKFFQNNCSDSFAVKPPLFIKPQSDTH